MEAELRAAQGGAGEALPAIAGFDEFAGKHARRGKLSSKGREEKLVRRRARSGCSFPPPLYHIMHLWRRSHANQLCCHLCLKWTCCVLVPVRLM